MSFTPRDFSELIQLLQEHPEWREQLRSLLLPQEVVSLPQQFALLLETTREMQTSVADLARSQQAWIHQFQTNIATIEQRLLHLEEIAAQQEQRLARLEEIAAQQEQRLARLEELIARQSEQLAQHEERIQKLEETVLQLVAITTALVEEVRQLSSRVERLENRQAKLSGFYYETHYRERAPSYLGRFMRRVRGMLPHELEETVEAHLSREEMEEFYRTDVVVSGIWREDDYPLFLAMEVSETVDPTDVVRAVRRAELLRKAGVRAVPAVAGANANEEALELSRRQKVLVITDGTVENLELVEEQLSSEPTR